MVCAVMARPVRSLFSVFRFVLYSSRSALVIGMRQSNRMLEGTRVAP
jgi:hypothetical protein